jgi:hypothetical protein
MVDRSGEAAAAPVACKCFYTVRSERQLMEQLDCNLLFRWFVGLNMDEPFWDKTVGLLRKTRHRGERRVDWIFTFVRIRNLTSHAT